MNFKQWFSLQFDETVYYGGRWGKRNIFRDHDLLKLSPEQKETLLNDIMSQLKSEGWGGSNYDFVINSIRHQFTTYNDQMDQLRSWPQGCKKLQERMNRSKQAYLLVKAIINTLLPDPMKEPARAANLKWLHNQIGRYKGEEAKLYQPCPESTWSLVGI